MCNSFEWHFRQNYFCQLGMRHPVKPQQPNGFDSCTDTGIFQGKKTQDRDV